MRLPPAPTADLTGEPMFMRNSIDLYHKQAADTGARIVPPALHLIERVRPIPRGTKAAPATDRHQLRGAFLQRQVLRHHRIDAGGVDTASNDPIARRQLSDPTMLRPRPRRQTRTGPAA